MEIEKLIYTAPGTQLFNIFQQAVKKMDYPKEELNIKANINNKQEHYRIKCQWQDENICGTDMYLITSAEDTISTSGVSTSGKQGTI